MICARGPLVVALCSLALGCGPSAGGEDSGAGGSGSDTGSPASTDTSDGSSPDDTAAEPGVCGDGVLDPGEDCDDGNQADADGCSHQCEQSGSVSWTVDLSLDPHAYAVALDVRDGHAYTGVQQYDGLLDFNMSVSRVSDQGVVVADFFDPGGLSDVDLARQSVASTPEGDFIAGYFVPDQGGGAARSVARIDFDQGVQWTGSPPVQDSFATIWSPHGIFVLRSNSDLDDELVVLRYSEQGELVGELPMGLSSTEYRPLAEGTLLSRPLPILGVLTQTLEGGLFYSSAIIPQAGGGTADSWDTVELGTSPAELQARAFAHPLEVMVWTEQEQVVIDMLDHPQPPEPRAVPGRVLVSFDSGLAIVEDQRIDVYDHAGTLRWSHDSTLIPRYARIDGTRGLLVLSDAGLEESTVHLDYLVL